MLNLTDRGRHMLGGASLAFFAALGAGVPAVAMAQTAQAGEINVPAMAMDRALDAIGRQSGVNVNFDPNAVEGLASRPVRGARSAKEAIQAAIKGASLSVVSDVHGGLVVINDIVVTARRDEAETSVLVRQSTTSDRNGLGLRNQPRNTQVITAKTIEEQQALNITDILRNAGGVSAQLNNPNSGASYTVRGFNASGLVNGLSTGSQYGVSAGANQPVANIERVEVLKGPDAMLSGFDNLGGNVNVVTKKPSAEQRLAVSFDTGSWGLVRGVIDANNAITADQKLSGRVIASAQTMNHNYGGYPGSEDYLFAPTLRYKDARTDIVVGASLSQSRQGIGAYTLFNATRRQIVERDPSVPIYSPDQRIAFDTDRFYFDATRQIVSGVDVVVRGMHDRTTLLLRAGKLGVTRAGIPSFEFTGTQQQGTSDAIDGFLRLKGSVGEFLQARFNVGYNYSRGDTTQRSGVFQQVLNPSILEPVRPTLPFKALGTTPDVRSEGNQQGVYAQGMLEMWKVKLLGGVRKNWFETSAQFPGVPASTPQRKNGTTPNLGVIFDATDWLSVFGNYSRGEQAIFTVGRGGVILPNIKTTNKEAGVKIDLFGKRATINASYFDIQQDNTIVRSPIDRQLDPGPGRRGRGIDLNIAGQLLPGWTMLGSLTRTNYIQLTTTSALRVTARQPRDTYSLYSVYRTRLSDEVSGGLSGGLYGRSSSYADVSGLYVVPAARQVDVNGFLTVAGFDINLGIRNLFDRRNYNTATTINFIPVDEPRNIRLSFTKRLF